MNRGKQTIDPIGQGPSTITAENEGDLRNTLFCLQQVKDGDVKRAIYKVFAISVLAAERFR